MVRAMHIVGATLMLTSVSLASPAPVEIGGFFGGDSTNTVNTGPCPVFLRAPSAPADECVRSPHDGDQGVVVGAHVRYRVLTTVSVEAGLTYVQKGYDDGNAVRLHYVEAPLLVRFDPLPQAWPARVFVLGGVSPAVLVGCHETGQVSISDPVPHSENYSGSCAPEPYLDRTPDRFDLSVIAGVGVGWRFGFGFVEVQARVERGLIDVDGWMQPGKTVNNATYVVAGFDKKL